MIPQLESRIDGNSVIERAPMKVSCFGLRQRVPALTTLNAPVIVPAVSNAVIDLGYTRDDYTTTVFTPSELPNVNLGAMSFDDDVVVLPANAINGLTDFTIEMQFQTLQTSEHLLSIL